MGWLLSCLAVGALDGRELAGQRSGVGVELAGEGSGADGERVDAASGERLELLDRGDAAGHEQRPAGRGAGRLDELERRRVSGAAGDQVDAGAAERLHRRQSSATVFAVPPSRVGWPVGRPRRAGSGWRCR